MIKEPWDNYENAEYAVLIGNEYYEYNYENKYWINEYLKLQEENKKLKEEIAILSIDPNDVIIKMKPTSVRHYKLVPI